MDHGTQITIYILKGKDFVITQEKCVLNKNALQPEEKRAVYHSQSRKLVMDSASPKRTTYIGEPEEYEVREVLSLT